MLDRFGPLRTALAAAGTVVVACTVIAPVASAPAAAAPATSPPPSVSPPASAGTIGGPQLAGRGVIVNYPPGTVPKLPGITAGATYVGMAKRGGHTLVVTLLHCPALTEITAAKQLLNWGFKVDGKVSPVGTLVGPQSATPSPAASPAASRTAAAAPAATRDQAAGASPSVLAAAGFSAMALVAAGLGFAYSRRQRPARAGTTGAFGGDGGRERRGAAGNSGERIAGHDRPGPRAGSDEGARRRP